MIQWLRRLFEGQPKEIHPIEFQVPSDTTVGMEYTVSWWKPDTWVCGCKSYQIESSPGRVGPKFMCKHIQQVRNSR